jgi:hypothetical protein
LLVKLHISKTRHLKYMEPTDYSQLRDHVRGTTLPLHVRLDGLSMEPDDTFIELSDTDLVQFAGLWLEIEESPVPTSG